MSDTPAQRRLQHFKLLSPPPIPDPPDPLPPRSKSVGKGTREGVTGAGREVPDDERAPRLQRESGLLISKKEGRGV